MRLADSRTCWAAGINSAIKMPMIAITTSNSTTVKAHLGRKNRDITLSFHCQLPQIAEAIRDEFIEAIIDLKTLCPRRNGFEYKKVGLLTRAAFGPPNATSYRDEFRASGKSKNRPNAFSHSLRNAMAKECRSLSPTAAGPFQHWTGFPVTPKFPNETLGTFLRLAMTIDHAEPFHKCQSPTHCKSS